MAPEITFTPGLAWCSFAVTHNPLRRSPTPLRKQLDALSDRHGGARAIAQSTRAVPLAYRTHYGAERSPAEELTLKRLIRGQYRSRGLLRDALLLATADTEVAVYALDADRHHGPPRVAGEEIVDDDGPLAPLFADPKSVTRATRRLTLFAITAPGIPDLAIEEALGTAAEIVSGCA